METVLITGCSSGIGEATARAFNDAGWTVYATARDTDDVEHLAEEGCETARLDVTRGEAVRRVVDRMIEETGRIDCLVNNAGYAVYSPVEDVPLRDVHEQFDVNVYGPHRLIRAVLPHMREQEDGTIVNLSSVNGRVSAPLSGIYSGSKFALEAMSDALRNEVAGLGIDVVLVEPGPVDTSFTDRMDEEAADDHERTAAYDGFYAVLSDASSVWGEGPIAIEPGDVAATILNAASCTDPASRYPVGTFARLAVRARFLPDRVLDGIYRLAVRFAG